MLAEFPGDLPATVLAVVHVSETAPTQLDRILARATQLSVVVPADGAALRHGQFVLAPPNFHLAVEDGKVHLWRGPHENHVRPAVDVLFRSAALSRGSRVIGVLLSGTLHDGAAGLEAIRRCGGVAVVQDPKDAEFPGMPLAAIEAGQADAVVPASRLAEKVLELLAQEVEPVQCHDAELAAEVDIARGSRDESAWHKMEATTYVCPACGGPLNRVPRSRITRFRCRVGHGFAAESLLAEQTEKTQEALWNTIRTLEDRAFLFDEMSAEAQSRSERAAAAAHAERAAEARAHVTALHDLLQTFERSIDP
jgi:two-component system chemotaxis response regulator CheB